MDEIFSEPSAQEYYPIKPLPEPFILSEVGEDLTYKLKDQEIGSFAGREKELQMIMKILGRRTKSNPMIIGEAGVGKTFLVKCLAYKIIHKDVPPWLLGKKIVRTSFNDIMATLSTTSDWKWPEYTNKLKRLLEEAINNPIIIFMDEIHYIFGYPESTNIIKPYLADGRLKLIGATTTQEYHRFLERNDAVARRFQIVQVSEPSPQALRTILLSEKLELERIHQIKIPKKIIEDVIKLSGEYLPYRYQPDKSIDILEQSAINCVFLKKKRVNLPDIRAVVSELTGIPDENLQSEKEKVSGLEQALNLKILGQNEVIKRIAERLKVTKNKVQINPERPLAVFLFAGPSGVGKTETAKALAAHFTGSEDNLIRIDMSIYQTANSLDSLLGTAGTHFVTRSEDLSSGAELPFLTFQLRKNPFAVLLLDEIEKAHPEVWTIFLQAFDYGRLVDYQNNQIFFNNVLVVMTCNVGLEHTIKKGTVGFAPSGEDNWKMVEREVRKKIEETFPKEFLGRIDDILIFRPLTDEIMEGFIQQKVKKIETLTGKEITLTNEVVQLIKKDGFDKKYGARPLNRAIDNIIGKALAELKMKGNWGRINKIKIELKEKSVAVALPDNGKLDN